MFSNPFSFNGRIRRLEFGLSYIIFIFSFFLSGFISETIGDEEGSIIMLALIPGYWFMIAQSAKRCHDLGNSGWYQLIPFYGLFLLFEDGKRGTNRYGNDPKDKLTPSVPKEPFQLYIKLPQDKSLAKISIEMCTFALLNTWLIVLTEQLGENYTIISLLGLVFSVVCCYFMLLYFGFHGQKLPQLKAFWIRHHLAYALLVYIIATIYGVVFQNEAVDLDAMVWAIFISAFFFGLTYIGSWFYSHYFTKYATHDSQ